MDPFLEDETNEIMEETSMAVSSAEAETANCGWSLDLDDCGLVEDEEYQREEFSDATLPAQLHPAVSIGMRRVSSCYFSIQSASEASNSVADLLSLLEESSSTAAAESTSHADDAALQRNHQSVTIITETTNASDVLFHDVTMHVLSFLDASSLAAFSETGRRPNFECFYFLQLQLQRAMLVDPSSSSLCHLKTTNNSMCDSLSALDGVGCLSRLVALDKDAARNIVEGYNDSNSTLRTMPLSHSLAYIRHVLKRNGFPTNAAEGTPSNALAGAAALVALVGAASVMASSGGVGTGTAESYTTSVLPNALFRVGLAGSLMRAGVTAREACARNMSHADDDDARTNDEPAATMSMREAAEQMARMMQEMPSQMLRQLQSRVMKHAVTATTGDRERKRRSKRSHMGDVTRLDEDHDGNDEQEAMLHPQTPNPYEHLQPSSCHVQDNASNESADASEDVRKMPSGCVGAYSRAIRRSASQVTQLLKEKRKANFQALSTSEQLQVSTAFIDACTSDETLATVIDYVQKRNVVDVDGFYTGSDGVETCALHAAALNGACRVLEFLCKGIDQHSAENDGGLCNVNVKDANQWTALHFAAGANSVLAVKILARNGAKLAVEAANGYTPFHWAQRLSNDAVANELQKLGADQRFLEMGPLSAIASRFFSLIPSH